jgi:hypothetical protein
MNTLFRSVYRHRLSVSTVVYRTSSLVSRLAAVARPPTVEAELARVSSFPPPPAATKDANFETSSYLLPLNLPDTIQSMNLCPYRY